MNTQTPTTSSESQANTRGLAVQPAEDFEIPVAIRESHAAFFAALPDLLKNKTESQNWVAFRGTELVTFGRSKTEAYQECLRRGLERGTFVVRRLEADSPSDAEVNAEVLSDV